MLCACMRHGVSYFVMVILTIESTDFTYKYREGASRFVEATPAPARPGPRAFQVEPAA